MSQDETVTSRRAKTPSGIGRRIVSVILLIVFGLASVLGLAANWSNRQISQTDAYVRTVAPLADEPAVQADLAQRISSQLQIRIAEVIPDDTGGDRDGLLSVAMRSIVDEYIDNVVLEFMTSDEFQRLWDNGQRVVHGVVAALLTGDDNQMLSETNGQVILDTAPLITEVLNRLSARGIEAAARIDVTDMDTQYVLFESKELSSAREVTHLLDVLRYVLPVVAFLAGLIYLILHRNRWRGAIWLAVTLMMSMSVFLMLVATGRWQYLLRINTEKMTPEAAAVYYDTLTETLRLATKGMVLVGLLALIAIVLLQPGGLLRQAGKSGGSFVAGVAGRSPAFEQAAAWTRSNSTLIGIGLIVLACLVTVVADAITGGWTALIILLALAGIVMLVTGSGRQDKSVAELNQGFARQQDA